MPLPFEPITLGKLRLPNRFVRSATWEGMARPDGTGSSRLVQLIGQLAAGQVGLIISSHAFVSIEGQSAWGQIAVYDDQFVADLGHMANAARRSGAKIVLQIGHAGIQANRALTKRDAVGPSGSRNVAAGPSHELTGDEIQQLVAAFASAAERAHRAGFDGVQVHAAHGYLLSQFLSPHFNQRQDQYGGSTANRARIVVEIIQEIRRRLGDSYPVLLKMNAADYLENGLTVEEMLRVVQVIESTHVDAIELSGGSTDPDAPIHPVRYAAIPPRPKDIYYFAAAERYKQRCRIPLILVGGIRSCREADDLLQQNVCDLVALCRPLIQDPNLIARWQQGDSRPSKCDSCNECLARLRAGQSLYCPLAESGPAGSREPEECWENIQYPARNVQG